MELPEFRAAVAETKALLMAMQAVVPSRVDKELIVYLDRLADDNVGLEFLRNAIKPKAN